MRELDQEQRNHLFNIVAKVLFAAGVVVKFSVKADSTPVAVFVAFAAKISAALGMSEAEKEQVKRVNHKLLEINHNLKKGGYSTKKLLAVRAALSALIDADSGISAEQKKQVKKALRKMTNNPKDRQFLSELIIWS